MFRAGNLFQSLLWFVCLLALSACAVEGEPTVYISSPPSGSQFNQDEDISVQSIGSDPAGIIRVELVVDDAVVRSDSLGPAQTSFSLAQTWKAVQGAHTVNVRAYNSTGTMIGPASIFVSVSPGAGVSCNHAALVSDVNIQDGATMAPAQPFVKTWRVQNSGTCAWGSGYQLVLVDGEAMTTQSGLDVPTTLPGTMTDLTVQMTAPMVSGAHEGQWRLRAPNGSLFGDTLQARINVTGGPATPACTGSPSLSAFGASANNVLPGTPVTLTWGPVNNAEYVEVQPGIGRIDKPDSRIVKPAVTTTYILIANCGNRYATMAVTINVVSPNAPTSLPPSPAPTITPAPTSVVPTLAPSGLQVMGLVTVNANSTGSANVLCPVGTLVTGGGWAANDKLQVYSSALEGNGWRVYANNISTSGYPLTAYAICLENTGGMTANSVSPGQVTIAAGAANTGASNCPRGTLVTGGGFVTVPGAKVYSQVRAGNGWTASAYNGIASPATLKVYAVCLSGATLGIITPNPSAIGNIPAGSSGSVRADCPARSVLASGGFTAPQSLAAAIYVQDRAVGETWETFMINGTGAPVNLSTYATCLSY